MEYYSVLHKEVLSVMLLRLDESEALLTNLEEKKA